MTDKDSRQYGPWPSELEALVAQVRYRHGWKFWLTDEERDPADTHGQAAGGLTLTITTLTANSYHARECDTCGTTVADYRVRHLFPVPATTWDRQAWLDWLMDRIEDVERHEAREFFSLHRRKAQPNGWTCIEERPFAPNHGPGRDPYRRYTYATDEQRRTSFRGEVTQ